MCEFFEKSEDVSHKEMVREIKKYFLERGFENIGKTENNITVFKKTEGDNSD